MVSSKKEELLGMLDHFNIQVENPVSVLTQEMSKLFLQSKNEGDKYKFFMKATQLEQMKEDYSYIMKTKENTRLQIEQGVEHLKELKRLYCEEKERYESIECVNEMQKRLEELKHKMAWAVVAEMEREIQPVREGVKAEEGNTEKFDQKLEECQIKINEAEEKYKAIQEKLITVNGEAEALHTQCVSSKAEVQTRRKAVNEAEVLYNRIKTELKRLAKDDEQLHNRIEEMKTRAYQASEPERLEKQRKITQLKEKLKAFRDEEIIIGQQMDQFQQAIYKHKEELTKLKEAFTAEGDQVFNRRYYSSDYLRPKYLSKDVEAEISLLENEIASRRAQLTASQQRLSSLENEIKQNESHLLHHRQHQRELQIKIRRTNAEITDLENIDEIQYMDIRVLEEVAEENKKKMESVKQEMQEESRKLEELNKILQAAEKRFEEIKEKINQVEDDTSPIKEELDKADSEVENRRRRWQYYEDKKKEHLACIKKHKALLADKEKELEEKTAQARQIYSERIEVSRTVKSLDAEMNRLRERIKTEKSHRGNTEEIIQRFLDAKERYEDANSKVNNLRKFIRLLEEIMTQRFNIYRRLLSFLPVSSRIRILRMQDPERGQKTLRFRNRNEEEEDD
ncbi:hypothetical protein ASZ78_015932 [Callipepla squamata]|uniref:Uncharacterized protein n=1 Tax=Callipepla squamata TaxID=9009 RepID=A0A226MWB0_CALSU|nr:hypothetical protein ASZ78_015932 [Callipepla squamata]